MAHTLYAPFLSNMNITQRFNIQLNQSTYDRFDAWKDYRKQLTSWVLFALGSKKNQSILVVGAGNLGDLDLQSFKEHQLHFLDIDLSSVKKGVMRQQIPLESCTIIEMDLTQNGTTS